jgi:hypothetical protein
MAGLSGCLPASVALAVTIWVPTLVAPVAPVRRSLPSRVVSAVTFDGALCNRSGWWWPFRLDP